MQTNRRSFLMAGSVTALSASKVLGANDNIRIGAIGCGGRMMRGDLTAADAGGGFTVVAGCDVYGPHRDEIRAKYGADVTTHVDYHEVLEKHNVDAVFIAAPDHWHVRMATDAIAAGKDVYLEKPVTHTMDEGEQLIKAVRGSKQVLQCGMQQRSWPHFQNAVALIQGGSLGRVTQIRTYWFQNYQGPAPAIPIDTQLLDWKRWLGGTPDVPFDDEKYRHWRWFWNYGGGAMTDLFTHWVDVVHWAMNSAEPKLVQGMGDRYFFEKWDCPDTVQAALRYPGFEVGYEGTMVSSIDDGGLEFRGTKGTLKIDRSGFSVYREKITSGNPVLSERSLADGTIQHVQNFFDSVRDRKDPSAPVEAGVAAARAGHLANLSIRRGDKVAWPGKPAPASR